MRRKTLVLSVGGVLAAAAVVGTAIGASAAESERQGFGAVATTAPAEPTPGTPPTGTPGTGAPTGTPSGTPSGAPSGSPAPTGSAPAGSVDSARAVEIALASAGGGQLDEVEREQEHGREVWSVELVKDGREVEVDVDTTTGEIVKTEQDDDKDDKDDDEDDDRDDDEDDD